MNAPHRGVSRLPSPRLTGFGLFIEEGDCITESFTPLPHRQKAFGDQPHYSLTKPMSVLDLVLFLVAVFGVISFGIWKSRPKKLLGAEAGASDYFLAGRGLSWWLVGFSLIAANISTEQFVGMSGKSADWLGMAIASYEWMAAVTLVVVAFLFLPKFLKCGIYTIPEFLEYRYGVTSRTVMAIATMVILVGVPTASVIFSGAKVVSVFFQEFALLNDLTTACWIIGGLAAVYVFIGGLRACAWTDLIWGSALIAGGAVIAVLAFQTLADRAPEELIQTKVATSTATVEDLAEAGAFERFRLLNRGEPQTGANLEGGKLNMVRPADDPEIPWTALMLGLWIPNFFYWGLNQYIVQRTLGSRSLAEGQKGVVFAASLKLIIPFVVVIPGILAFNLFSEDLRMEATQRNAPIVAQFEAEAELLFPFALEFARTEPELSRKIVMANAARASVEIEPEWLLSDEGVFEANRYVLSQGAASGLRRATELVGYDYDAAFPTLLRNLLFPGMYWFVLAAITGAVISSLASMLNSASTIFTMDIYTKLRKGASQHELVKIGRVCVVVFVIIACLIAPSLGSPAFGGIFTFIQEFQGFISPGVLAIFLFGMLSPRTPRFAGWFGILLNVVLYGSFKLALPDVSFLNRMALCFVIVIAALVVATLLKPLRKPVELPENPDIDLTSSKGAKYGAVAVCVATAALYGLFW